MLLQISCDYQDPLQDSINNVWLWGRRTHTRLRKPPKQFSTLPPRLHQPKACKRACDNTNSLGLAESPKHKNSSSPAQSASNSPSAVGKRFTFQVYSSVALETRRDPLSPLTQARSILPSISSELKALGSHGQAWLVRWEIACCPFLLRFPWCQALPRYPDLLVEVSGRVCSANFRSQAAFPEPE